MATNYNKLKDLARDYLLARHTFRTESEIYPELRGNDNITGRIGELIAIQFLRQQDRQVQKYSKLNHPINDLLITASNGDERSISVKLISAENQQGTTTRLKYGWDEFILVELNAAYKVQRLGWLTIEALRGQGQEQLISKQPITSRRMLSSHGLIGQYGIVYDRSQGGSYAQMLDSLL